MVDKTNAPIIIRRRKIIAGGGHHGGAWKVAYADFVTAMMAFFLLMWLLGATNEKQRKGIADYFSPTIPINKVSGGGDGAFGGDSVFAEETLTQTGTGSELLRTSDADRSRGATGTDQESRDKEDKSGDDALFEGLEMQLTGSGGESMVSDRLKRHVVTRVTDEGLVVEIYDLPGASMFSGDAVPEDRLVEILGAVADVFRLASNKIAVRAHVASTPLVAISDPSWPRSLSRADAARGVLEETGLSDIRFARVEGHADRDRVHGNPLDIRNNRVEVVLLRRP